MWPFKTKKQKEPAPRFRVKKEKIKLPEIVIEFLIVLRNNERRHAKVISREPNVGRGTKLSLITGNVTGESKNIAWVHAYKPTNTCLPNVPALTPGYIFKYTDQAGHLIQMHQEDVFELIIYPPRTMPDTYEVEYVSLEKIPE